MTLEICLKIKVFQKARSKSIKVSLKCNNYSQKTRIRAFGLQIKSMPLTPQQEQMHKSEQEGEMTG